MLTSVQRLSNFSFPIKYPPVFLSARFLSSRPVPKLYQVFIVQFFSDFCSHFSKSSLRMVITLMLHIKPLQR